MKRMTIPAMLVAAVLAFALAGCSGAPAKESMTEDMLKGVWSLDKSSDVGFGGYLNFDDEKLFEMIVADSYIDGEWSVSGTEGTVKTTDDHAIKLSYASNKLTLGADDGSKLVFVKDDSNEAKEMFAYGDDLVELGDDGTIDLTGEDGQDIAVDEIEYVDEVKNDIEPVTLADDATATIVVTQKGTDFTGDPAYWLTYTNKLDRAVYFAADDVFHVGDVEIDAGIGDEVEAGETLETSMYFPLDELEGGLEALVNVNGTIVVYDNETDDEIARYDVHLD